ncbi:MAG: putative outer membrane protein [Myxococcales bacterium]|nr:putative outer membrane protein [Myxococcales bacterium]
MPYIRFVRRFLVVCMSLLASARAVDAQTTAPSDAPGPVTVEPPAPPPSAPLPAPKIERETGGETERRAEAVRRCEAHEARCDWAQTFSSLERSSVLRVLSQRGYELEPEPWGKVIGHVNVFNEDVFAEKNWLQFFNFIHYTTRDSAIRSELTINAGEVWDPERVAESARNIRDPLYSSVIALVPVKSTEPGKVDLLVVTRDVWSLRFNSNYTFQEGSLTNLTISLSENNFLGHRALLAGGIVMDQGSIAVGPIFIDKNLLGKHLDLRVRVDEIFTRRALAPGDSKGIQDGSTFHAEGKDATITLARPVWSLATRWGWGTSFTYRDAINRVFNSTQLRAFDNPATPEHRSIGEQYRMKQWSVNANAITQWGRDFKQQLSFGNTVASQRPSLLPNFPDNIDSGGERLERTAFIRGVLPRSELISSVFLEYAFFVPRYRTLRNVGTYELAEDVRIGPDLDVSLAQGLKILGSDSNFQRPSLALGWTFPLGGDGFVRPSAGISLRVQDGTTIDNTASAQVRAATPTYRYFRVIAQSLIETRWHDTQNAFYVAGSNAGLRGFRINQFFGDRHASTQIEARSIPFPLWVFRMGGVLFYELGGAADTFKALQLHHDVGFGLRVLIPQTSREVFRFDLAFPLDSSYSLLNDGNNILSIKNPAFAPHFVAGFESYF